jgi:hypothetical protein
MKRGFLRAARSEIIYVSSVLLSNTELKTCMQAYLYLSLDSAARLLTEPEVSTKFHKL